ncbi:hypothetical protein IOQ59_16990 [Pontibacterium sp. N1Y112]|uniref:Uncharacterized protein n=1 Tax=Pontibacterium sinense TaxID=2781979 RepID=A0A8J7JZL6_9GAMM|nr:hypothetical protein [Pontibacterium sinense]MBE9398958.1 hypothetical protein [Pontibacterium sinense]
MSRGVRPERYRSLQQVAEQLRCPVDCTTDNEPASSGPDIYLLFRHSDPDVLPAVIIQLEGLGFSLYVDQMPHRESTEVRVSSEQTITMRSNLATMRYMLVVTDHCSLIKPNDYWLVGLFDGIHSGSVAVWWIPSDCDSTPRQLLDPLLGNYLQIQA